MSATTTRDDTRSPAVGRRRNRGILEEVVVVVMRFDPFRDVDRFAERLLNTASDMGHAMRAVPMDVYRAGDHVVLHCDLPGADPGSIDVGVDGRTLTVRAERSPRAEDVEWLTQERPTGTFVRQLTLGGGLDLEHIEATYADGVLTVSVPVAEQAKPRKVAVTHLSGSAIGSAPAVPSGTVPSGTVPAEAEAAP